MVVSKANSPSGFSFQSSKNGKVFIRWHGKEALALKGPRAAKFIAEINSMDEDEAQNLMARLTGNFKRGNERSPS